MQLVLSFISWMLLGVKAKIIPSGPVSLLVNGENEVEVSSGEHLLSTLVIIKFSYPQPVEGVVLVYNVSVL